MAQGVSIPTGTPVTLGTLAGAINNIAEFLMFAGAASAVIFLVWAGVSYVMAGSDSKKVSDAKQMLKTALIGSLIIFGVGSIIATLQLIGEGDLSKIF